ncbi:hypothetical protein TBR22_A09880 [Luteitalea sp. TBR-22]|uniref:hypothetical protein n=1 Tax=Luteitalea sp. TBR-22 TaxID=2802971 RepID=UPI001AF955C1|nr:hypothetical protein [Luteitalea sp. TBR-22]BCS31784.1 hypothetical protein TBR22_A09880 [Luteitalea sp. TBR-22]
MSVRHTIIPAVLSCLVLSVAAPPIHAQGVYEGFQPTFPQFATGQGLAGAWTQGGFNVLAAGYTVQVDSLAFQGLQTSGGRVSGGAFTTLNGAVRNLLQAGGADYSTMYISFLVRPLGTLNAGIYSGYFGVTVAGGPANELFIGKGGGGDTGSYVLETRGGSGQVSSGVPVVVGQTALLVVRADFLPGNDVFTLYVNPTPGGGEPSTGTVKSDINVGAVTRLGIYSSGAYSVDEIRVGASFAEVTPRVAFAGSPGAANCTGQSVSALASQYKGIAKAAAALGYDDVTALQGAIADHCTP